MFDIQRVVTPVRKAVKGVRLAPVSSYRVPVVYVVSEGSHLATVQKWAFFFKTRIRPIFAVGNDLFNPHKVDQKSTPPAFCASCAYDIVADHSMRTNLWFTGGKGAYAEEWIGREPVVMIDDIGVEFHVNPIISSYNAPYCALG